MKKLFTKIALAMAGFTGVAVAQQDPQFTQFMYNKLIYNPGYAGTSGAVCGVIQYRNQWLGFEGSPTDIAASVDMRLKGAPLGVGISVISDKIGPMSTTYARIAGSFNKKIGQGTLGAGIDVGIIQKSISSDWIVPEPLKNDPRIPGSGGTAANGTSYLYDNPSLNKLTYDVGAGVFYQIPGKFYIGGSMLHIPSQQIKDGEIGYKVKAHYYFMAGYTFQPTKWSKIIPNLMYKNDLASSSLDANLTFLWSDMIWVGGTYRIDDAAAILAGVQGQTGTGNSIGWKLGLSYDLTTPKLKTYSKGTVEVILGVCYTPKVKKTTTYSNPRYLD
ncbi:MAG: type IX secretion system membrane protein PorP/SprF [Bacteroidia bacterium]|nr:type IX secretion system membrane protein PorP/SprF [Bacteroidia bacterium]